MPCAEANVFTDVSVRVSNVSLCVCVRVCVRAKKTDKKAYTDQKLI